RARNEITDSMLAQITRYYQKEYGSDSTYMFMDKSDTINELHFADTSGGPDHYRGTLFVAYIPLVTDINPTVRGDVNGDGKDDLVFTVHTEGGGGGGNVWWDDHFLFLGDGSGQYTLADIEGDNEIMKGNGYFFPDSIVNQTISGVGNGYGE